MKKMPCCYCLTEDSLTFQKGESKELATCQLCGGTSRLYVDPVDGLTLTEEAVCPHGVECPEDADSADDMAGYCKQCDDEVMDIVSHVVKKVKDTLN